MGRPRYSIAGLMGLVLFCAVGTAALRYASELWASVLFTLALATLMVATVAATCRRGEKRSYWLGAAIFGWGYAIAVFSPWFANDVRPHLLTTKLLDLLQPRMQPPPPSSTTSMGWTAAAATAPQTTNAAWISSSVQQQSLAYSRGTHLVVSGAQPTVSTVRLWLAPGPEHFQRVGHSLFAVLIALLGGGIARVLYNSRRDEGPAAPTTPAAVS